jgi:hypothetical protein
MDAATARRGGGRKNLWPSSVPRSPRSLGFSEYAFSGPQAEPRIRIIELVAEGRITGNTGRLLLVDLDLTGTATLVPGKDNMLERVEPQLS